MIFVNTKLIFKVLIIITLSGSIVLFSDTDFFLKIFSFYNINHRTPSFADFRSYQALPLTIENFEMSGYENDYIEVCINDMVDCCQEIEWAPPQCD